MNTKIYNALKGICFWNSAIILIFGVVCALGLILESVETIAFGSEVKPDPEPIVNAPGSLFLVYGPERVGSPTEGYDERIYRIVDRETGEAFIWVAGVGRPAIAHIPKTKP